MLSGYDALLPLHAIIISLSIPNNQCGVNASAVAERTTVGCFIARDGKIAGFSSMQPI
jgi:hypothetical protein